MSISRVSQRMAGTEPITATRARSRIIPFSSIASTDNGENHQPLEPNTDGQRTPEKQSVVPPTQPGGGGPGSQPEKKSA